MRRRQTVLRRWMIIADESAISAAAHLERGSGILLLKRFAPSEMRRLRVIAGSRRLVIVEESPRSAARVHNARELRRALLGRPPLIFLSPVHETSSHPEWKAMPRMRAAALARLGGRTLLALGGMNDRRFERVKDLGFEGWAGISAFRT